MNFACDTLLPWLLDAEFSALDDLEFGVVGLDRRLVCTHYNRFEERASGLSRDQVLGLPFFEQVAVCMNNYLVADRLRSGDDLDLVLPYTLSVRVAPQPVHLRLLVAAGQEQRFLAIDWHVPE